MSAIDTSTWTDAQKAEFAALEDSISDESSKVELAEARREAERLAPANQIAEKKAELAAKKKAAELAAKELEADKVYRKAIVDFGGKDRVARIRTEMGSVILRPSTIAEFDELGMTLTSLNDPLERSKVVRESLAGVVIYPSQEVFKELTEKYPGTWQHLLPARDDIADGLRETSEKKG